MMLENADKTIQDAQQMEKTAFAAKKQGFHELKKSIHRRYGEDLLDHYKVRKYAIQVKGSYESSALMLYVHILPDYGFEETLKEINDSEIEDGYRVSTCYRREIKEDVRRDVFGDLDLETDINIKVKTEEQFERLRK